jgi:uncharacterized protein DUF3501
VTVLSSGPLTIDDILDARAYERERDEFRDRVIALKKLRRVSVGPVVTLVFENRETIRFQVQEMARAEKLYTDEAIEMELDTYNPLISRPGRLSASLFIELTSRGEMERWLPKLVGVERSVHLVIGELDEAELIQCDVDEFHQTHLSREEVTAAVHFVYFSLNPAQVARMEHERVALVFDHPYYRERSTLSDDTKSALREDLVG